MIDKKDADRYKKYLRENLSKKRYQHSLNVAEEALKLAEKYSANKDKCFLAALLHDCCKEKSNEEQRRLAEKWYDVSEIELNSTPLLHAIAGAQFVCEYFDIQDMEVLNAIRRHTVAAADMSDIDKIIYLADLISEDRTYKDVKKMRRCCYSGLDAGMYEALQFSIGESLKKGNTIPNGTIDAYNNAIIITRKRRELSK